MERIDKVISEQTSFSRREAKILISKGRVKINNNIVKKIDEKLDVNIDKVFIDNKEVNVVKNVYLLLNKPKGYVSATEDENDKTVIDLVPMQYRHRDLFPVGRLDKDTTGLLIITDDGKYAHDMLSPKKHVEKIYEVEIDIPITDKMIQGFKDGVELVDCKCKPAVLEKLDDYKARVIISEGKYHQIKRMFGCFKAKVINLKRIKMGEIILPDDLKEGEIREIKPFTI